MKRRFSSVPIGVSIPTIRSGNVIGVRDGASALVRTRTWFTIMSAQMETSASTVSTGMLVLLIVNQSREKSHSALAVIASTVRACGFGNHANTSETPGMMRADIADPSRMSSK